jgi:hypothetical protein
VRAVVARRTGERVRKPTQFFDEERVSSAATDGNIQRKCEKKIGDNKRYASINVRTLAMKGDKNRKEACGQTAAAVEWIMEFEARGLGVVGLQECRIPGRKETIELSILETRTADGNMEWAYIVLYTYLPGFLPGHTGIPVYRMKYLDDEVIL